MTLTWRRCSRVNAVAFGEAFFGRPKVGVMCFFPVYTGFNCKFPSCATVGGQWKQLM